MKCELCKGRLNAVPGEGPRDARLMLVGEAPGKFEDRSGRPFVGQAGRLLDGALLEVGLSRNELFITSVVKCRPPDNRVPKREETEACLEYLKRQVAALRPKVIITLGRVSYAALTGSKGNIQRGPAGEYMGVKLISTYHPAVALHGHPQWIRFLIKDLGGAVEAIK